MNDNEYYSLMNRTSSWELQQKLKKTSEKKQNEKKSKCSIANQINENYANLEARQGSADAQMLMEKNQ